MKLSDYLLPGTRTLRRRVEELQTRIRSLRETRDGWKVRAKTAEAAFKKCNRTFQTDPHRTRGILEEVLREYAERTGYTFPVPVFHGIDIEDDMIWSGNTRAYFTAGLGAFEHVKKAAEVCDMAPHRILDLPCGHGRVARFLRAWRPDAALLCADIQEHGVVYCSQHLQAIPVKSHENPERIHLDEPVDLVWVGSLFTHLGEHRIEAFLHKFAQILKAGGVLVFTTHGEKALARLQAGETYHLRKCDPDAVCKEVAALGFAYRAYHYSPDYGVSFGTRNHMESLGEKVCGFESVSFEAGGWGAHQDVHVWRRAGQ